ncbi:MAG: thermonuclease family protein [Solirubrobacterales bacterium]|nr:thermonuclease family protein [Solirubrobacterales bacterium]
MLRLAGAILASVVAAAPGCSTPERESGGARERAARVARVADGDTVVVSVGGSQRTVRLIGVDSPESVRPGTPVECGAPRASESLEGLLREGTRLRLVADPSQDRLDRYGRLLRYVELERSGTDVGAVQVRRGWADVYVYGPSGAARRTDAYERARERAEARGAGVFGACDGDFHSAR